ncbi:hypothetical protein [Candidatus Nitrotoga fabula]|uniref:Uncharacterized protein n=1 Tax=Candidatus Nitrotoga fabula TaxID=2182327 RepID=A0A916BEQ6_9PROT|nr:hypothetical protein [Candidatus Nitrotoga fabula]CAE6723634.1 conserved hypothetical protein [Candidatus Nitrotoga fabula]
MPAPHIHKQIRDALVAALAGLATTGSNVFANRVYPLTEAEVPALRISMDEEEADEQVDGILQREVYCIVEACAKLGVALDDALDQISLEVEPVLAAGITVDGQLLYPVYTGMRIAFEDADLPVGVKRMRYRIPCFTHSSSPELLT